MGNSNSIIELTYNNTKLNLTKDGYYLLNPNTNLYIRNNENNESKYQFESHDGGEYVMY